MVLMKRPANNIEDFLQSNDSWVSLEEGGAGRSRLNRFINQERTPFFIISAWRGENTSKENKRLSQELVNRLKSYGIGVIPLWGVWVERDRITGEKRKVRERSFLVVKPKRIDLRKFREIAVALMKEFGQEAIVFGDGEAIYQVCNKAVKSDCQDRKIGSRFTFDVRKIEDIFSAIKGHPFTFESVFLPTPKSWAVAIGLRQGWGIAYSTM